MQFLENAKVQTDIYSIIHKLPLAHNGHLAFIFTFVSRHDLCDYELQPVRAPSTKSICTSDNRFQISFEPSANIYIEQSSPLMMFIQTL